MKKNNFNKISTSFQEVQNNICGWLEESTKEKYKEDLWDYERGNGGGRTRIFCGNIIEKGGVSFSSLSGRLNPKLADKLKISSNPESDKEKISFKACGVSLVIHPYNPFVPTVHLNVRYFECQNTWWFGGGMDLTPYYPIDEDILLFHKVLKKTCDDFDKDYYLNFKRACDEYFYLPHRKETRGVGGIFFDHLKTDVQQNLKFSLNVALAFQQAYMPILQKRYNTPFRLFNRQFQAYRRGRYVEFNLLYDRGTSFGLESGGRVESILMSLPPKAEWIYNFKPEAQSEESQIAEYLKPRDWLTELNDW